MRIGLVTTTINVPHVLKLYGRASIGYDVRMFVAADERTPSEAYEVCAAIPTCEIYSPMRQRELGYECSALLGFNNIGRRNIALLEAVAWGADVLVLVDDDNIGLSTSYFYHHMAALIDRFDGLMATGEWFDVGTLLDPIASHRGFPHECVGPNVFQSVTDAKIGVAAGICLGDPDISAVTRIANHPMVHRVSELLRAGIVVDPGTWTVFNSQNTAFIRDLAPCFLMVPQFGRHDDIFASLIAQRVMREKNLHVHFGQPFVWQQRNEHDLLKDLKAEQWGSENILAFAEFLDFPFAEGLTDVIGQVRALYAAMVDAPMIPDGVPELGEAWCEDVAKVLG